jgi:Lipopolysaccharide biosynthesis proteins, LPS:glycosyltransferases
VHTTVTVQNRRMTSSLYRTRKRKPSLRGGGSSCSSCKLYCLLSFLLGMPLLFYLYASSLIQSMTSPVHSSLVQTLNNDSHESIQQQQQQPQQQPQQQQQQQPRVAQGGHHHCLNQDFQPEHKVGIWTMLNDNMAYTLGAAKMGRGIRRHTQTPHDLIVMEIESKPLGPDHWAELTKIGFKRCVVQSIPPPKQTRPDLKEKFAVLHVWAMTVYDTVLFIDADTFVQNSLDELIHLDLKGKTIGVTKDIRARKWVDTFNSGVLLLHPDEKEYKRLIELLNSGLVFDYVMSDQGFLNEVYKDDWHEIGFFEQCQPGIV